MFPIRTAWQTAEMGLVTVDLPAPAAARGSWAARAALHAARGWGGSCHAAGTRWHYDDSGGNWGDLHLLPGGRAVLVGHDHEYSETYWGAAADYFGEEETDLLAEAPHWWAAPARSYGEHEWVGFVYGFEGGVWQRADFDLYDGLDSVGVPGLQTPAGREATEEDDADWLVGMSRDSPHLGGREPSVEVARELIAADGRLDEHDLRRMIGDEPAAEPWDVSASSLAALRFHEVKW